MKYDRKRFKMRQMHMKSVTMAADTKFSQCNSVLLRNISIFAGSL